jgi:hypothetical protein
VPDRRFPPPWTIEELDALDSAGQKRREKRGRKNQAASKVISD